MKGLHKHHLDFEIINVGNPKILVFLDCSEYYKQPDNPVLDILVPGISTPYTVNIESGLANTFNSNTIGITSRLECDKPLDLPDGIYKITYKIQPYDGLYVCKYFLRTEILDSIIEKIYADTECTTDILDNQRLKKEIVDIHILIESAKANAVYSNIDKSQKDYRLALKKAEKLSKTIKDV